MKKRIKKKGKKVVKKKVVKRKPVKKKKVDKKKTLKKKTENISSKSIKSPAKKLLQKSRVRIKKEDTNKRVPTGIKKFDKLIEGGFEYDSVNLVAGGSGSGKTIFAMQFLIDGIKKGEPCLYITFEESKKELEKLSRGWVQRLSDVLGPHKDVPAPDVNTTAEIMAWMTDEFEKISGDKSRATFTGKPIEEGGSEGREKATGLGGFYVFDTLQKKLGLPEKCKIVIQGFGNVGRNTARIFAENGHIVTVVSDSKSAIFKKDGLNLEKVEAHKKNTGGLKDFPEAKNITNAELLELPCDLLIPAAFENVITDANANKIRAKAILELANGPITPEADEILFKRNIPVIPDILANSGGVTVSYFEWDQNLKNEHWTEKEIFEKLKQKMEEASGKILEKARESKTSLRMGAFILALERIQKKML